MSSDNESLSGNEVEVRSQIVNNDSENENTGEIASHETEVDEVEDKDRPEGSEPDQNKQDAEDGEKKIVKPKGRKKQLYPNPKFNENTVRTPKGLPAILGHFQGIKFKGRGYEEQDLNRLLKIYEYWSHRFYPKYKFDDSIQRLEVLGNKRGIQVYLKKIRMGIEDVFQEEITQQKLQDEEEIPVEGFVEPFDDQFDQLLASTAPASEPELTEEQLERIKQNKLRAEKIRREKMSKTGGETSQIFSTSITSQSEVTEVQENNEEIDLDNILDMINEDDQSHLNSNNSQSKNMTQEQISNAIRKNPIVTGDNDITESDDDTSTFGHKKENSEQESEPGTSSQRKTLKRNKFFIESDEESEENSNNNSNDSSNDSSADSMVLNNSLLRKKHKHNSSKILVKRSQNALNQIKKLTVSDSDDDKDLKYTQDQSPLNKSMQKQNNIRLDNMESLNLSENSNRQRKKINISDSDEDLDNRSNVSVLKMKRKVLDSNTESLSFSQNSTKLKQTFNISDTDEDEDTEIPRHSHKKSKLVKNGHTSNSDTQVSQSLTKSQKRHNISDSDEDSNSNNVITPKKYKNGFSRKGKKPVSVTQNVTKEKKKKIVSDSDEESSASQNSSIKSMPLKSSQGTISNENNSLSSDSGSITTSQDLLRHKNKKTLIDSDDDSNPTKDTQITSDHDLQQNSQSSLPRRKKMVIESDEDSNDAKESFSEHSIASKNNNSILEKNGSMSSSVNMNDSTKNKKRHIIESDTSDEENSHKSGLIQRKKKIISSDEETN